MFDENLSFKIYADDFEVFYKLKTFYLSIYDY